MNQPKNKILIVDDDPDDRQIIRDAFQETRTEKELIQLENGDQLIYYLNSPDIGKYPQLILLDLNMPGKDGREALREVKGNKLLQHIPIIVFTTSSLDKDRNISYELGANCFLTKPNSYSKLIDIVRSISNLWLYDPE